MDQSLVTILMVSFFFTTELLTKTAQCAIYSSMDKMANGPYYNLLTRLHQAKDGKCEQHLQVVGRGLSDSFSQCCTDSGKTIINADKYLIYENAANSFSLFSDTPTILVVIAKGQCTRKAYVTNKKKSTTSMSATECKQVEDKIKQIKRDNFKDPATQVDNGVALETPESEVAQDKKDSEEEIEDWNF